MSDISSWLTRIGLDKYIDTFLANEVDWEILQHLTESDLKELGLPLGPRRKILSALERIARDVKARVARPLPERRQLTVMFVDLVGSTALSQALDPEEMRDLIRAYQSAVSTEITRYEGHVAKLMGDGVLAYFGWPTAHENDAERAVRAGLAAAVATAALKTLRSDSLAARIGIATGVVVVGDLVGEGAAQEEAVVGETPNLAARLQALAEPNTVVIADSTRRLIGEVFEVADLGQRELRGFVAPVRVWRVAGEADTDGRFAALQGVRTPLIGRARELELLHHCWQQALTGRGQVVLVSGEPGIGKSRLIAEFQGEVEAEAHTLLHYSCSSFHVNSALHPIIKQLERAAEISGDDNIDTKLNKLEDALHRNSPDVTGLTPLFAELLSLDITHRYAPLNLTAQARKSRILNGLIEQLRGVARREPVMMIVEDAHWIDPTTSEWLDMVIDNIHSLRVFVVVTFRPEFTPHWTQFSNAASLFLSRLGRDEGGAIIDRLVGGKSLPLEVRNQVLTRTDGIPLFVEELTRTVLESDLLVDVGDRYELSGLLPPFAIPSTLQDSLMARLDRLVEVKEVAQIGACIGRVFHYPLLAAVTGYDEAWLEEALGKLENSELLFRRGIPPEASYTFKHALVQDAAYQSLLKSRRRQIHGNIAAILESQFSEIIQSEPETLAHHYTAAGLVEQAVPFWLKAGQQALRRSANSEAIAHLTKGLESINSLPDSDARLRQEIQLQSALGVTMMAAKGWSSPDVLQAFSKTRLLSEKLGDDNQLFVALCGEATYHMISGNLRESDELGQQCMAIARASGDTNLLLEAHHRQWATTFFMGDYAAAERHTEFGIATYVPEEHHSLTYLYTGHDPGVCSRTYSAEILWLRGYPDQALARVREAVALAERVSHPFSSVLAQLNLSCIHLVRREPAEARRWLDKWIASSNEFGFQHSISMGRFQIGWALAVEGQSAEGVREMREGIAAMTATGAANGLPFLLSVLARACGEAGEPNDGLEILERALHIAHSGAKCHLAELLRVKGELLLRRDSHDSSAEGWLRQAMSLAQKEETKTHELRAAFTLACLYRNEGRNQEARDLLASIYDCFSEGFETRDLLDAKDLLNQLQ